MFLGKYLYKNRKVFSGKHASKNKFFENILIKLVIWFLRVARPCQVVQTGAISHNPSRTGFTSFLHRFSACTLPLLSLQYYWFVSQSVNVRLKCVAESNKSLHRVWQWLVTMLDPASHYANYSSDLLDPTAYIVEGPPVQLEFAMHVTLLVCWI